MIDKKYHPMHMHICIFIATDSVCVLERWQGGDIAYIDGDCPMMASYLIKPFFQ